MKNSGVDWPRVFVAASVLGVIAFAWYGLSKPARAAEPPEPDIPPPEPLPPQNPLDDPQPLPPSPAETMYLGNPLPLRQGQLYRARLELTGFQSMMANASAVMGKFSELGFADVHVWHEPASLPFDWPTSTTMQPGKGTWFVQGKWTGPDARVPKPDSVWAVWEA